MKIFSLNNEIKQTVKIFPLAMKPFFIFSSISLCSALLILKYVEKQVAESALSLAILK